MTYIELLEVWNLACKISEERVEAMEKASGKA